VILPQRYYILGQELILSAKARNFLYYIFDLFVNTLEEFCILINKRDKLYLDLTIIVKERIIQLIGTEEKAKLCR
jgi:hypothetical protein